MISVPADAFHGHGFSLLPRFAQSGCFRSCYSRRSRRIHSNQLIVDTIPNVYKTNYDCSVFSNNQVYSEMKKWMTKGIERRKFDAFCLHYLTCSRSVLLKSNIGYSPLLPAKIANSMKKNIVNTFNSQIL